ncbi:MAG: chromosome partitioning protein [Flavobacteriales bacterium]|jgi:chromosome partitioning protein
MILGIVKQKGGVGASTLARTVAANYASADWNVKIADMDTKQGTSTRWNARRLQNEITPSISVEQFNEVKQAVRQAASYDLLIFDGAPHSSVQTLEIAKASDVVVIPTGTSLDDLEPSIQLAYDLTAKGINKERIVFAFCRIGNSAAELEECIEYIKKSDYKPLEGVITEKTAIRRSGDLGLAANETKFKTVNDKVNELIQSIVNELVQSQKAR